MSACWTCIGLFVSCVLIYNFFSFNQACTSMEELCIVPTTTNYSNQANAMIVCSVRSFIIPVLSLAHGLKCTGQWPEVMAPNVFGISVVPSCSFSLHYYCYYYYHLTTHQIGSVWNSGVKSIFEISALVYTAGISLLQRTINKINNIPKRIYNLSYQRRIKFVFETRALAEEQIIK